jgi:hypothetical protein
VIAVPVRFAEAKHGGVKTCNLIQAPGEQDSARS